MSSVIDLELARQHKLAAPENKPDPHLVRHDEYGRPLYCFILEYEHQGGTYHLDFWTYSEADAMDHLLSMMATISYVGQKMSETPA